MRASGFTLLELLIVLALIGLVAAVVVPGLARTYDAIVSSGERADVVRALEGLPLRARSAGESIAIDRGDRRALAAHLQLPEGWTVDLEEPLRIEHTGLCHPTRVRVAGRGAVESWTLGAPSCGVADAR
jgi:prepilin-type N-terminal cleavage/methylation domain-containing protein